MQPLFLQKRSARFKKKKKKLLVLINRCHETRKMTHHVSTAELQIHLRGQRGAPFRQARPRSRSHSRGGSEQLSANHGHTKETLTQGERLNPRHWNTQGQTGTVDSCHHPQGGGSDRKWCFHSCDAESLITPAKCVIRWRAKDGAEVGLEFLCGRRRPLCDKH